MTKLKPYLKGAPKPTGVKKATVSSDPIVSALAGSKAQEKYKPAKQPKVTPIPKIKPKTTTTLKKWAIAGLVLFIFVILLYIILAVYIASQR